MWRLWSIWHRDGKGPATEDQRTDEPEGIGGQARPRGTNRAVVADEQIRQDHIGRDDRGGIDQVERVASRQQKTCMQILLGEHLENDGDSYDGHRHRGGLAEIGAENDVRDVRSNHGETQARRQRNAEQKLHALAEMRSHGLGTLTGVNLHGEREKDRRGAHRRHHESLPDEIEARDIFSGFG